MAMEVKVNGDSREIEAPASIARLLDDLGLADRPCAVELNRRVVPRAEHASTTLREGDRIELVTLVGGG